MAPLSPTAIPSSQRLLPNWAHPLGAVPSLALHAEDQLSAGGPGQGKLGGPGQTLGITEFFC